MQLLNDAEHENCGAGGVKVALVYTGLPTRHGK